MNPVNNRIKQLRTVLNISQQELAKKIYISQSTYGEIETGVRKVNDRIIQLICSQFSVNKDWLKTGNGEMFGDEKPDIRLEHLNEIYRQLDETLKNYLLEQKELLFKLHNENKITKK